MSKKIKKVFIFAIFLIICFLLTTTSLFSKKVLWPTPSQNREFSGIIFQNPSDIDGLKVERTLVDDNGESLIKYHLQFSTSSNANARILGTPVRQVFVDSAKKSNVTLKGDFYKVNNIIYSEHLKLKDFYNDKKYNFLPNSHIKLNLDKEVKDYKFDIYYRPCDLYYRDKSIEQTSVFLTNSKVKNWKENSTSKNLMTYSFTKMGFHAELFELINDSQVKSITTKNTLSTIVFIASAILVLALIWLDRKNLILYLILLFLIIPSIYGFINVGVKTIAILTIYPILAYLASIVAKLLSKDDFKLEKNDFKQSLAFTILFFLASVIVFIIPRAF